MTRKAGAFGMTVSDVVQVSPKRLRISGTVEGDRLYRGDIVEVESEQGKVTAFVQSIRLKRKRENSADPGETVSLVLPGVKKEQIREGDRLKRSHLGGWKRIDLDEETEFPVNVTLLKKSARRYVRLSPERRALTPVYIASIVLAVLILFSSYRWIREIFGPVSERIRAAALASAVFLAWSGALALVIVCFAVCERMAGRHIPFDKTPIRLTGDRIELSYRLGSSVIKSEIFFADIDSIEYYPRFGCVRVNAPVRLTKIRNETVVGTKFERSSEKAFQVYFLIYMDNDLFMRTLSERSGVTVKTVGALKPDVDGARF